MLNKFMVACAAYTCAIIYTSAAMGKLLHPSCGEIFCFVDVYGFVMNIALPMAELATCVLLVLPASRPTGAMVSLLMAASFIGYWSVGLFFNHPACDCFGSKIVIGRIVEAAISSVLLACSLYILRTSRVIKGKSIAFDIKK